MRAVPACIWGFRSFESCLSLQDLCTLSQTHKEWQEPVIALYSSARAAKLRAALEACIPKLKTTTTAEDDSPNKLLQQLWRLVSCLQSSEVWGKAVAATPGLLADFTQLHTVSDLPRSIIACFVQHLGVCMNYQQLLTAAYSRVARVEVWVQVQHKLGIYTDIPVAAMDLCCEKKHLGWLAEWQALDSVKQQDMMQLLLNRRPSQCVFDAAVLLLPQVQDAAMLLPLLLTAITRGHNCDLLSACDSSAVEQLEPAAVLQLMQADVAVCGPEPCEYTSYKEGSRMTWLVKLPAAASLTPDDLLPLIEAAIARNSGFAVKGLCKLSALQQISEDVLLPTIAAAIKYHEGTGVRKLCKLPAAQHASPALVADWLTSAVAAEQYEAAAALCGLSAAQSIPQEQVLELVHEVVNQEARPAQTTRSATKGSPWCALAGLQKLKTVQNMSSDKLLELFDILAQHRSFGSVVSWISDLQSARSVPVSVMKRRMRTAVQQQDRDLFFALRRLPAAKSVTADALLKMLRIAVKADSKPSIRIQRELCYMAASTKLDPSQLMDFLHTVISSGQNMVTRICSIPAASKLTPDNVAELLSAAVKHHNAFNVKTLCKYPKAAKSISSSVLQELISTAVGCGNQHAEVFLRQLLPDASQQA